MEDLSEYWDSLKYRIQENFWEYFWKIFWIVLIAGLAYYFIFHKNERDYRVSASDKIEQKNFSGAIEIYSNAINAYPKEYEFYNLRAKAKELKRDYSGALEDYNNSIKLDSNYEYSSRYEDIINLKYHKLKDYKGTIEYCNKALKLWPKDDQFYFIRDAARDSIKDFDGMIDDYNDALETRPDWNDLYIFRGKAKFYQKDYIGAIVDFNKAIDTKLDQLLRIQKEGEEGRRIQLEFNIHY
ncbi:MAG: hypothetical protein IPG12_17010 [Saprospiraceae bacterium]|nr:hypothetical protein [Saprospiraceae bacterium]